MLANPSNQVGWPEVIMKDVDSHVQELRNVLAEVRTIFHVEQKVLDQ